MYMYNIIIFYYFIKMITPSFEDKENKNFLDLNNKIVLIKILINNIIILNIKINILFNIILYYYSLKIIRQNEYIYLIL